MTDTQDNSDAPTGACVQTPPSIDCPACGYSLRGLPMPCTCPECGLPCDPYTEVVRLAHGRNSLKQVILGILLLAMGAAVFDLANIQPEDWWYFGTIAALTLGYLLLFTRGVGRVSTLRLTPRGVQFDAPGLDPEWIEWTDIDRAKYSWWTQRFYLVNRAGKRIMRGSWRKLGSPTIARRCARAINNQLPMRRNQAE